MYTYTPRRVLTQAVLAALIGFAQPSATLAAEPQSFNLAAQSLQEAITALATQASLIIGGDADLLRGKQASALQGEFTPEQALEALLQGSGVTYTFKDANTVQLSRDVKDKPAGDSQSRMFELDIPSQGLAQAADALSAATGDSILVAIEAASAKKSHALQGTYTVEQALNAMTKDRGLVVKQEASDRYSIKLAEGAAELAEVVVTGSYTLSNANSATGLDMSLRDTPQAVSVITQYRMQDQNLTEISDVIDQSVGMTYDGTPLGSDGDYFFSRGLAVTNYQVDGIPRPAGIYGYQLTTADTVTYDRIEIVRGATGLMNGIGNPSASVNLIRKRPSAVLEGNVSAQMDSWGKYRLALDVGNSLNEAGTIRGRVAVAKEEGGSHIVRTELKKEALYAVLEADLTEQTLLTAGVEYQSIENNGASRSGLPLYYYDGSRTNFDRSTNAAATWSSLTNEQLGAFINLQHNFNEDWRATVEYEHIEPKYDDAFGYLWGSFERDTGFAEQWNFGAARWAADLDQDYIRLSLTGKFDALGQKHDLVMGLSHSTSDDDGTNYCGWWCGGDYAPELQNTYQLLATGEFPQPDFSPTGGGYGGTITQESAYGALRLRPVDRLALVLGTRFTNWSEEEWNRDAEGVVTHTPKNEENDVVTPYVGVLVDVTDTMSAYASYTQIFEPQNYRDIDDNRLDPLEGTNYEVGLKADIRDGLLSAGVNVYYVEQDNFAVWVPDTFTESGASVYRAEKGTTSRGFEIEVAGEILPGWQMVGGFSRSEPEDNDDQPLLTDMPTEIFKLFSSYQLEKLLVGGNLRWQSDVYVADDGPEGDQTFRQGSLYLIDLMVKFDIADDVELQLNANNIFDKKYYSGFGAGIYGEPFNMAASVRYRF